MSKLLLSFLLFLPFLILSYFFYKMALRNENKWRFFAYATFYLVMTYTLFEVYNKLHKILISEGYYSLNLGHPSLIVVLFVVAFLVAIINISSVIYMKIYRK